ncbi:hypothetical protein QW180_19920 [Vibrio sinaloensis]|nr:hypothetical protein [Vibrio sinaloensis]
MNYKKSGVAEHLVAQVVGHKHNTMTYGHYAKRLEPQELIDAVNSFDMNLS